MKRHTLLDTDDRSQDRTFGTSAEKSQSWKWGRLLPGDQELLRLVQRTMNFFCSHVGVQPGQAEITFACLCCVVAQV